MRNEPCLSFFLVTFWEEISFIGLPYQEASRNVFAAAKYLVFLRVGHIKAKKKEKIIHFREIKFMKSNHVCVVFLLLIFFSWASAQQVIKFGLTESKVGFLATFAADSINSYQVCFPCLWTDIWRPEIYLLRSILKLLWGHKLPSVELSIRLVFENSSNKFVPFDAKSTIYIIIVS